MGDFFQSKEVGQDGGEKKSSGSKGNGEKVDEPEGDLTAVRALV